MREIYSHTALRGIAAIIVVLVHYRIIIAPAFDIDRYTSFFAKGYLWVDCFFILSGFILCHVYGTRPGEGQRGLIDFLKARFARIYPLHLATLLGLLAAQEFLAAFARHPISAGRWSTFWPSLFGIQAWLMPTFYDWNFPSWSISVEFAAYLLFPLACFGLSRYRMTTLAVMLAMVLLAATIDHDRWEQTAVLRGVPMFFLGVLIFQFKNVAKTSYLQAIQAAAVLALTAGLHFGAHNFTIDAIFAALILFTWTDGGFSSVLRSAPLQALGNWSYSIYMLHIPVRFVLGFVVGDRVPPVVLVALMISVTIAAGAVSYRIFEMPLRRILKGRQTIALEPGV